MKRVDSDIRAYFEGSAPIYTNEHRVQTKDGSYKWILDRGIVVARDENGNPLRMVGSHTDITAQKEADKLSRYFGARYRICVQVRRVGREVSGTVQRGCDADNSQYVRHDRRFQKFLLPK